VSLKRMCDEIMIKLKKNCAPVKSRIDSNISMMTVQIRSVLEVVQYVFWHYRIQD